MEINNCLYKDSSLPQLTASLETFPCQSLDRYSRWPIDWRSQSRGAPVLIAAGTACPWRPPLSFAPAEPLAPAVPAPPTAVAPPLRPFGEPRFRISCKLNQTVVSVPGPLSTAISPYNRRFSSSSRCLRSASSLIRRSASICI